MNKLKKKLAFLLIFMFLAAPCLVFADDEHEPEPYTPAEFSQATLNLRRGEIVTFGSLPFTMMWAGAGYSVFRYFNHGMKNEYAPSLITKNSNANFSKKEQNAIIIGAAGASLVIGLADFIVGQVLQNLEDQNSQNAKNEDFLDPDITIIPVFHDKN